MRNVRNTDEECQPCKRTFIAMESTIDFNVNE
jgi:hypothetical protein